MGRKAKKQLSSTTTMRQTLKEFGCSIRRTSTECVQLAADGEFVAEAKVGDFDVQVAIEQQVLCLEKFNVKFKQN